MRKYSAPIDHILIELQHGMSTCHTRAPQKQRPYPARKIATTELSDTEQRQVAGLMRINNASEVATQGLYRGQALTARRKNITESMTTAAEEGNEHLNWCQQRLAELNANRSRLDGLWYWGSFTIGVLAGAAGEKWSLGFVEETEKQVCNHLDSHLAKLPQQDLRSRAIVQAMKEDEMHHAVNAHKAGAAELPKPIKKTLGWVSKIMTFSAYRI